MSLDTTITINGDQHRLAAAVSLAALLAGLGIDATRVAVERNRLIVPRSTFDQVMVEAGDVYEIVHFVGGG